MQHTHFGSNWNYWIVDCRYACSSGFAGQLGSNKLWTASDDERHAPNLLLIIGQSKAPLDDSPIKNILGINLLNTLLVWNHGNGARLRRKPCIPSEGCPIVNVEFVSEINQFLKISVSHNCYGSYFSRIQFLQLAESNRVIDWVLIHCIAAITDSHTAIGHQTV